MNKKAKLHPKHVPGKYYVDDDFGLCCNTCIEDAPEHFEFDEETLASYVIKQPDSPEEEEKCQQALLNCALEAIGADGGDLP